MPDGDRRDALFGEQPIVTSKGRSEASKNAAEDGCSHGSLLVIGKTLNCNRLKILVDAGGLLPHLRMG